VLKVEACRVKISKQNLKSVSMLYVKPIYLYQCSVQRCSEM